MNRIEIHKTICDKLHDTYEGEMKHNASAS